MKRLLLFGGTTEARRLAQALCGRVRLTVCVATEYGRELMPPMRGVEVRPGRMDSAQMAALMRQGYDRVVDATHPYASEATGNIRQAAALAGIPYLRLLRGESGEAGGDVICRESAAEAARYLGGVEGNALLAIGAKELAAYTVVPGFSERLYVRILPALESLERCLSLGFRPDHILAMQGPFSAELNRVVLADWKIGTMVTRDSGAAGGFDEKRRAAQALGVRMLVVGRPAGDAGLPEQAVWEEINHWLEGEDTCELR